LAVYSLLKLWRTAYRSHLFHIYYTTSAENVKFKIRHWRIVSGERESYFFSSSVYLKPCFSISLVGDKEECLNEYSLMADSNNNKNRGEQKS